MTLLARLLVVGALGTVVAATAIALRAYFSSGKIPRVFDHSDVGADIERPLLVEFTSPFCHSCKVVLPVLKAASLVYSSDFALVDAKERPELIHKYGVRTTPTILVVEPNGWVRAGWQGHPPSDDELARALSGVTKSRVA